MFMDPIMNNDDSDGSVGYVSDFQFSPSSEIYNSNCIVQSKDGPFLEILEQPADFRYRYEKEKYHGHILGLSSPQTKKKDACKYPAVKVYNYNKDVIVRCWLISTDLNGAPKAHFHKLNRKLPKGHTQFEPHDIHATQKNGHIATFDYMYIVHAVEKGQEDLDLYEKKKTWLESGLFHRPDSFSPRVDKNELKTLDKNQSILLFQAFDAETKEKICESFISRKIKNLHNPVTAALKIVNYSLTSGSCKGGDEIFMFFEKISKDVEIRVFVLNEKEERIFDEKAIYNQAQIHHQCGVVFKTPAYSNTGISSPVQAYFELYRKNDHTRSEPVPFLYKPHEQCHINDFVKKRRRTECTIKEEDAIMTEIPYKISKDSFDWLPVSTINGNAVLYPDRSLNLSDLNFEGQLDGELICNTEEIVDQLFPEGNFYQTMLTDIPEPVEDFELYIDGRVKTDGIKPSDKHNTRKQTHKSLPIVQMSQDSRPDMEESLRLEVRRTLTYAQNLKIMESLSKCIELDNLLEFDNIVSSNENFNINSVDNGGNSVFLIACSQSLMFVNHLLKNENVDKNITNFDGDNALLVAVKFQEINIIKELLVHNFEPNVQNYKSGETPLHYAVLSESLPIIKMLIEYDADPVFEDCSSGSPYQYSLDSKDDDLKKFISIKAHGHFGRRSTSYSSSESSEEELDSQLQNLRVS